MTEEKPTVFYIGHPIFDTKLFPGHEVAYVRATNHPKLGRGRVRTSSIIRHFEDGFETQNTIYKAKK